MNMKLKLLVFVMVAVVLSGCGLFNRSATKQSSRTTGWSYNDPETGNIPYISGYQQEAGPGLVFIEGGTFTMGRVEEDVMSKWDNTPRRITVASFYMDETEVSNQDYREYLFWLSRVYPNDMAKVNAALPDTLQWRQALAYNEPYIQNYLRHPAYSDYPVVGVSWVQADAYCSWRTDRVNENILVAKGIITLDLNQSGENVFTTDTYLAGMYQGTAGPRPQEEGRPVRWEDGILLPKYRLPTEAEWEYAALALIGNTEGELLTDRKMYPWNGAHLRVDSRKNKGRMQTNFTRGRGDLMGIAGALNDNADIAAPIKSYLPNDFGLYCMAGNVNEWVFDVYRPLSFRDVAEFQPVRGNIFTVPRRNENGDFQRNQYGEMLYDTVADYRNFQDGDPNSQLIEGNNWLDVQDNRTQDMYIQDERQGYFSSLIGDDVRVYKGGSWKDRPYWLTPGSRRYLQQNQSQNDLGFRCAMTRVGSPGGF
jgi:gliding motility-associated lipoprotein GldJ